METSKIHWHSLAILAGMTNLGLYFLNRFAFGVAQGDGTPTPEFTIDPISLLLGVGLGALAVGVPILARSIARRGKSRTKDTRSEAIVAPNLSEKQSVASGSPLPSGPQSTEFRESPTGGGSIGGPKGGGSPVPHGPRESPSR